MKKIDKNILVKLEQLYHNSMDNINANDSDYKDVPDIQDDSEYKTNLPIPSAEQIEEPDIKTKSGKNILRELPPEETKIDDLEIIDGDENDDWDMLDEAEDPDNDEESEEDEEDDDNGMGNLASNNINTSSDQNNETGEDPNIDPNQENPEMNANSMMGGVDNTGMDPSEMNQNVDPITGQPIKTAEQVGKIFELKKIYSRLLAIQSQLSFSSDITLLKLRKFISNAIELFETLISNIDAFQNDIDDIIVMFYEFLEQTYEIMKKYYKIQHQKEKKEGTNK